MRVDEMNTSSFGGRQLGILPHLVREEGFL